MARSRDCSPFVDQVTWLLTIKWLFCHQSSRPRDRKVVSDVLANEVVSDGCNPLRHDGDVADVTYLEKVGEMEYMQRFAVGARRCWCGEKWTRSASSLNYACWVKAGKKLHATARADCTLERSSTDHWHKKKVLWTTGVFWLPNALY